jgi:hypothetical protein
VVLGDDGPFHAWSTIKVPVVAALLSVVHLDALTSGHRELIRLAITESDNAAILELFVLLERLAGSSPEAAGTIERLFRLAGDPSTIVARDPPPPGAITSFGQTGWSAGDSARFFSSLAAGRLLNAAASGYLLELMQGVVDGQCWGLAVLDEPTAFKGGWGPEADGTCLVRQSGLLLASGVAVSLIAQPPPGPESFEQGVMMLGRAAVWCADWVAGRVP